MRYYLIFDFISTQGYTPTGSIVQLSPNPKNKIMKKKTDKTNDWTGPDHLLTTDHADLKKVKNLYEQGKFKEAMEYASNLDTTVREEIPGNIWLEMGGSLTKTGEEKLGKESYLPDTLNPKYMFNGIATLLITEALKGQIDVNYLMRQELVNRGVDINGKWVGFPKAAEIHKMKKNKKS